MSEEKSQTAEQETAASDAAQAERVKELEAELLDLLRRKYLLYWRRKEREAVPTGGDAAQVAELNELTGKIRAVFDQIRLIDKKYIVPPFRMFD